MNWRWPDRYAKVPHTRLVPNDDPGQQIPTVAQRHHWQRRPATATLYQVAASCSRCDPIFLRNTTGDVVVSSGADATDFGASARVYWTLKVLGLKELSVLNGGVKAWGDAKLPQTRDLSTVAASNYQSADGQRAQPGDTAGDRRADVGRREVEVTALSK